MPHPFHGVRPGRGRPALRAAALVVTLCAGGAATTLAAPFSQARTTGHTVVAGDTLWSLALQSHTTVARLQALNSLKTETILLGQTLQLPARAVVATGGGFSGSQGAASGPPGSATYSAGSINASRVALAGQSIPSHTLAQQYIRTEALRQGVPVSLALAVAYQESGFSQGMVSPTDAVGIMQLEPGTADWVGSYLLGRPLNRYNAYDNVVGGVALLRNLLSQADTPTAVAGYYQGLKGVRQRGMFADTRAYVASVLALQPRFS